MSFCFSTLLDIDKLTQLWRSISDDVCFSTLLDIDKLTPVYLVLLLIFVLVLCWILINLHYSVEGMDGI